MLKDSAWHGNPAFIIGGGPSLKSLDWSVLIGLPCVIAVNVAFIDCPTAAVVVSEDERFFRRFAPQLASFAGEKIFSCPDESFVPAVRELVPDIVVMRAREKKFGWSRSLADGLSMSSSSLTPALNLADILGAEPIYLLGVDMRPNGSGIKNYHDRYPEDWTVSDHQLTSFASDITHWAAIHMKKTIINLNRDSALDCWPKALASYNDNLHRILGRRS